MPIKYKLKKNDPVVVISGKDKSKKTKITLINKEKGKVIAEGVNVMKRHTKPNQTNPDGGIIDKAMPFDISNVMYLCKKCDKGVKLGVKTLDDGKKTRFCKKCGELID